MSYKQYFSQIFVKNLDNLERSYGFNHTYFHLRNTIIICFKCFKLFKIKTCTKHWLKNSIQLNLSFFLWLQLLCFTKIYVAPANVVGFRFHDLFLGLWGMLASCKPHSLLHQNQRRGYFFSLFWECVYPHSMQTLHCKGLEKLSTLFSQKLVPADWLVASIGFCKIEERRKSWNEELEAGI